MQRYTVLVVDDDLSVLKTVNLYLRRWPTVQAVTAAQALQRVKAISNLALIIVDLNLPDSVYDPNDPEGTSFLVVSQIRQLRPDVPLVVFSAYISPALVNAAQRLGVEYIVKEDYEENLTLLAERLDLAELAGGWAAARYLQQLRDRYKLSQRQLQVAALAARGLRVADIAKALRLGINTIKRHSLNLRQKTGHPSLRALAQEAHGTPPVIPPPPRDSSS